MVPVTTPSPEIEVTDLRFVLACLTGTPVPESGARIFRRGRDEHVLLGRNGHAWLGNHQGIILGGLHHALRALLFPTPRQMTSPRMTGAPASDVLQPEPPHPARSVTAHTTTAVALLEPDEEYCRSGGLATVNTRCLRRVLVFVQSGEPVESLVVAAKSFRVLVFDGTPAKHGGRP